MADESLYSPIKPHFFQPLLPGFHTHLNIPVAFFMKYIEGRNNQYKTAKLRSDASKKNWLVKLDGLKITDGWEDFAFAHDLRTGDIVIFRHEGEMVFHVTALGPSFCEIQYTSTPSHNINSGQTNIAPRNNSRVKKNPRKKVESSTDHSCFVANVSAWGLSNDRLYIPLTFARFNGLNKMRGKKIYLQNEEGRSWKVGLGHDKTGMRTCVKSGWRRFCAANEISQGQYTFQMVRKSEPPILRLCRAKPRPKQRSESEFASDHSCFEGFVNPSSLSKDQLYLPKSFVSSNDLDKRCSEIILKNEQGIKWSLALNHYGTINITFLRKGWTSFCHVNGIKSGDSFKFKLVGTWKKPVLSLCPAEFNHNKTPLECSEGSDYVKLEESEEEINEDKNISQHCLEIKKRKYWSRCRASLEYMDGVQTNIGSSSRVKKNPRKILKSSSDHSSFVANVTASSLRYDRLYLRRNFVGTNSLDKGCSKIVLQNELGRGWTLLLKHYESRRYTILIHGWTSFCKDNGLKAGDSYTFKLVETGEKPILSLCPENSNLYKTPLQCSEDSDDIMSLSSNSSSGDDSSKSKESEEESNEDKNISQDYFEIKKRKYFSSCRASTSYTQNQFVTLTLTRSAFQSYKLYLPRLFTQVNDINKPRKITLLGQDGVKRVVDLYQNKRSGAMRFGKGWREFCEAHGVKTEESFVLELIWEDEASPVLKFCTKVNSA